MRYFGTLPNFLVNTQDCVSCRRVFHHYWWGTHAVFVSMFTRHCLPLSISGTQVYFWRQYWYICLCSMLDIGSLTSDCSMFALDLIWHICTAKQRLLHYAISNLVSWPENSQSSRHARSNSGFKANLEWSGCNSYVHTYRTVDVCIELKEINHVKSCRI